jgi:hypothetical protein
MNEENKNLPTVQMAAGLPAYMQTGDAVNLFQETLNETTAAIKPVLQRITIAAGGINNFMVAGKPVEEINCIILAAQWAYALWPPKPGDITEINNFNKVSHFNKILPDGDLPGNYSSLPLCTSLNGHVGTREGIPDGKFNIFGRCVSCRFGQFGSDLKGGGGKACKQGKRLLLLMPGASLPSLFTLPPTSSRFYDEYASFLISMGLTPMFVYTKMTLDKKISAASQPYSIIKFDMPAKPNFLSDEDYKRMDVFRLDYASVVKADITEEDYEVKTATDAEIKVEDAPSWESGSSSVKSAEAYQVDEIRKFLNYKDFTGQGKLRADALNATNADSKLTFDEMAKLISDLYDLPDQKKKR